MISKDKTVEEIECKLYKMEEVMSNLTCCFTGHRPQKLSWGFNEYDVRCFLTKKLARAEIIKAIEKGYKTFLSGMAIGFDTYCAEIVLDLKRKYPDIKLVCVLPCKNQDRLWNDRQKKKYKIILNQADVVLCLHINYTKSCMEERNHYMINKSSLVIALFDGQNGGTENTINYARKQGKEVVIIKPVKENVEYNYEKALEDKVNFYVKEEIRKFKSGEYVIKEPEDLTEEDYEPDFITEYDILLEKKRIKKTKKSRQKNYTH